jgi:hypothetical protein
LYSARAESIDHDVPDSAGGGSAIRVAMGGR